MLEIKIEIYKPPVALPANFEVPTIFLGGSIEMGAAQNWQEVIESACKNLSVALLNPRRDNWDSSWEQKIENPEFSKQVEWELAGLERASLIVFYFDPNTKSPITLLELGLHAASGKALVCCPEGFWRKGNVDIVCKKFGIPQVDSLDQLVGLIQEKFK